MLRTAMKLLSAENREKREAAKLFLRFALHEHSEICSCEAEELRRMDFRVISKELTGSEDFTDLSDFVKENVHGMTK